MLEDQANWFYIDLGDAILATTHLHALKEELTTVYESPSGNDAMQALYRHESGETQCHVIVYITDAFQQALFLPDALACKTPQFTDLSFLAGKP